MSNSTRSNPAVINREGSNWQLPLENIKLEDGQFVSCSVSITPNTRKALLFQGTTVSENKATLTSWSPDLAWVSYGGPTDKWGLVWTPEIINNSTFGFCLAISTGDYYYCGTYNGNYYSSGSLELSGFGFAIPLTATIDGIKVEVKQGFVTGTANIDNVKITVYYTGGETSTNMKVNIGDSWKTVNAAKINIGDNWKNAVAIKQKVNGDWKNVF